MTSHQCGISALVLPHVISRENPLCWRREMLANFSQALPEPRFHCGEKWQKSVLKRQKNSASEASRAVD